MCTAESETQDAKPRWWFGEGEARIRGRRDQRAPRKLTVHPALDVLLSWGAVYFKYTARRERTSDLRLLTCQKNG